MPGVQEHKLVNKQPLGSDKWWGYCSCGFRFPPQDTEEQIIAIHTEHVSNPPTKPMPT
jgi:hypothetical protein